MKHQDALTIAGILSDVITSRRGASLFPHGKEQEPSAMGAIWVAHIEAMADEDTEVAARAAVALATDTVDVPTIKDFDDFVKKLKHDERMAAPQLPPSEFVREMPDWVRGWIVARSKGDMRAWPEQEEGANFLQMQHENIHSRAYVWADMDVMPDDDREAYMRIGMKLSVEKLTRMMEAAAVAAERV